jgi:hypothetical protein
MAFHGVSSHPIFYSKRRVQRDSARRSQSAKRQHEPLRKEERCAGLHAAGASAHSMVYRKIMIMVHDIHDQVRTRSQIRIPYRSDVLESCLGLSLMRDRLSFLISLESCLCFFENREHTMVREEEPSRRCGMLDIAYHLY